MPTTTYSIADDLLTESLENELVLLDLRSGSYFGLSEIAAQFWIKLREGKSVEEVYADLLNEYDVSPQLLRADLNTLLQSLETRQLIIRN